MNTGFLCPVCGFRDAAAPPFADGQGDWYQEICPSCGTQFGYDDASRSHFELRAKWVQGGAKWWSPRGQPVGFDGLQQLRVAGLVQ